MALLYGWVAENFSPVAYKSAVGWVEAAWAASHHRRNPPYLGKADLIYSYMATALYGTLADIVGGSKQSAAPAIG